MAAESNVREIGRDPRRQELIIELLRLAADPFGFSAQEGVSGDDGSVNIRTHEPSCTLRQHGLRCTCWLASLDELHRCLRLMRTDNRRCWYQVHERYIAARRQPKLVHVKNGRPQLEPNQHAIGLVIRDDLNSRGDGITRLLVETWREGLNDRLILEGVQWLADTYQGSPQLPQVLLKAAA